METPQEYEGPFTGSSNSAASATPPLRHGVKVSKNEDRLFGDDAPLVRKIGDALVAIHDAVHIARTYLEGAHGVDDSWSYEERVKQMEKHPERWVRWVGPGGTTGSIVSEHTDRCSRQYEELLQRERDLEKFLSEFSAECITTNQMRREVGREADAVLVER